MCRQRKQYLDVAFTYAINFWRKIEVCEINKEHPLVGMSKSVSAGDVLIHNRWISRRPKNPRLLSDGSVANYMAEKKL